MQTPTQYKLAITAIFTKLWASKMVERENPKDPRTSFEAFRDAMVLFLFAFVLIQFFWWVDPRELRDIHDDGSCER